jgi:cell volume regulation protein A
VDPNLIILALSAIVIGAYAFDIVGRKAHLPSVVLLIAAGIVLRRVLDSVGWSLPYLTWLLPVLGTIGLVLIVLEGALDLELSHDKKPLLLRTLFVGVAGLALPLAAIAATLHGLLDADWTRAVLTACPFAVISSAVAIPSVAALSPRRGEFVVYESALSDILGVSVFAALLAAEGDPVAFALNLTLASLASLALGLAFIALLYVLLNKLTGHVKFLPIFFLLMLLYAIGKLLHLSPLVLVLAFGLLLNNAFLLRRIDWLRRHESESFDADVAQFKQLVAEGAFFVRTYFFLLLGYDTLLAQFAAPTTWLIAAVILVIIYLTRLPLLALAVPHDVRPLLWIAPRGLITVMLYLSLPERLRVANFPEGSVMLVVLLTALVMMIGIRRAPGAQAPGEAGGAGQDAGRP